MNSFVPNSALLYIKTITKDNISISQGSNYLISTTAHPLEVPAVANYSPIGVVGYNISPTVGDGDGSNAATTTVYRLRLDDDKGYILASLHANSACKVKLYVDVLYARV